MGMGVMKHRQVCDRCGGAPTRAVRTRKTAENAETVYYLAFTWACSVCGNSWIDAGLERQNAQAEQAARRDARDARHLARRAS
jgi:hypothetical protein